MKYEKPSIRELSNSEKFDSYVRLSSDTAFIRMLMMAGMNVSQQDIYDTLRILDTYKKFLERR